MPILGFWGFGDPPWPIGTGLRCQNSSNIPPLTGSFKGKGGHTLRGVKKVSGGQKIDFFFFCSKMSLGVPRGPWEVESLDSDNFRHRKPHFKNSHFFKKLCHFSQTLHPWRHPHALCLQKSCETVVKSVFFFLYGFTSPNPHLGTVSSTQGSEKVTRNHFSKNWIFSIFGLDTTVDGPKRGMP